MLRVGLVGCGTIGSQLARAIERKHNSICLISALHDVCREHAADLQRRLKNHPPIVSLERLIRQSRFVVEAASTTISARVATLSLRAGRDVLIMSAGGLLQDHAWQRAALRSGARVYIPSGALAGLDAVKAMAAGKIYRATLTTRKPPRALMGAPLINRRHLKLDNLARPKTLFMGSPQEVVRKFPQNTNVAAALALGAQGAKVRVRVVADPSVRRNVHELEIEGKSGRVSCRVESRPSANPKTSDLAVNSAIATFDRIVNPVAIGT